MEEIKVNEYVRTKNGNIFKIVGGNSDSYDIDIPYFKLENTEEDWFESNRHNDNGYFFDEEHIVKHSKDIIDLIECGDYVNGYKVSFIAQDCAKFVQCDYPVETGTTNHYKFYKESIRDIVTKEQFKQMKYIVGGE